MSVVREMTRNDLDAIKRLEMATPEAPHWTLKNYQEFLLENAPAKRIFVAEEKGKLTGFIAARIVAGVCELESIVVDRDVRRGAIGTSLFSTLFKWVAEQHAHRLELEVRVGNGTAIEFYRHHNFQIDGRRPGYYHDPIEDALLLSQAVKPT